MLVEGRRLPIPGCRRDHHHALAEPERRLDRIGEPGRIRGRLAGGLGAPHDEPVHDHFDRVALVLVEALHLREVHLLAVHPDAHEPLLASRLEDAIALGLAILDERTQHEEAAALG